MSGVSEASVNKLAITNKIDPTEFDVTISALLIGLNAEKYISIFRKNNIGQCTLSELTDEDLLKLGVDDAQVRQKLLEEVKNLPMYEETTMQLCKSNPRLGPLEIVDIMAESSQHLHRIYLSMLANSLAIAKTKRVSDCLVHNEKYASDIAIATLSEISTILNSMDIAIHTQLKTFTKKPNKSRTKKMIVGTFGTATIAILAVLFLRSLKQTK